MLFATIASAQPVASPANAPARVIVKLKSASALASARAVTAKAALANHAAVLGERLGIALRSGAAISHESQVVIADGITARDLANRLAQQPDVEYAVPDEMKQPLVAPNDPLYMAGPPGSGPAVGQWYLRAPSSALPSSIDAEPAWSVTTGNPHVIVAVIDTGVRYDHPDLAANLLSGYDMVSNVDAAIDGNGRDADASDPGDWVTQTELSTRSGPYFQCMDNPRDSTWHGTQVAGLVAAVTNNGIGMASVGRNVRVLPVRVIGKCGGADSDIMAGMRWAVGLPVPGVPANPAPAKVLNLSLGGEGACNAAYEQTIAQVLATGATIVVAAGNSAGHAVKTPGNCPGVIAVGALRHVGTKAGFSNIGPEVAISAPGGNCINTGSGAECLYPILTTSNAGTTIPAASTYSDAFKFSAGTSFATPLVAATTALMLSANASLNTEQIRSILQSTARAFPTTGADTSSGPVAQCTMPQLNASGTPIDQLECYCTTATCGAGMLDTGAAVIAAASSGAVANSGAETRTVIEFYNAALDHYFISWMPDEIATLDAGTTIKGWARTGYWFKTYQTAQPGTSPVCRFYIPPGLGDSHFFGRGTTECNATAQSFPTFVLEDPKFMHMYLPIAGTCPSGTTPVYRVFDNRPDANHRYTSDAAVRGQMVTKGWLAEGDGPTQVVMCAPE